MLDPRAFLINSKTGRVIATTFVEFLGGDSTTPSICFTDSPDSGLQCDNSGTVNYIKNGTNLGELGTENLLKNVSSGTAAAPGIAFDGDPNTGIYSPGADQVAISTNGTGRLFVDANGQVGVGQSVWTGYGAGGVSFGIKQYSALSTQGLVVESSSNGSSLNLGHTGSLAEISAYYGSSGSYAPIAFKTSNTERLRIDGSGRLLVGTSSAGSSRNIYGALELEASQAGNNAWAHLTQYGNSYTNRGARLYLNFTLGTSVGSATAVTTEDELGAIHFRGANGTTFQSAAEIRGETDTGTISGTSMPGRLVFSSTPSGSASPVERLRITSAGVLQIADAGNIAVGTTTGTKIGTATTQKLGFFNKTPVAQPTAVADATDAASVITQLNALLARMRDLGLIAT